jgi:hypothetical protein
MTKTDQIPTYWQYVSPSDLVRQWRITVGRLQAEDSQALGLAAYAFEQCAQELEWTLAVGKQ